MKSKNTKESYHTIFANVAEMENSLGKELGLTEWYVVDQNRINSFAETTEDLQWIHLDAERCARESPYKKPIAHGFLMVSMCSKIMFDSYKIEKMSMAINYGMDKVRFPNATPVGSRFRGRVTLAEFQTIPKGAKYKLKVVIELEGEEKPACVAEFLALAYN